MKKVLKKNYVYAEWCIAAVLSLFLLVFIHNNFVGVYSFHTSSMNGTLEPGDILWVNKLKPGTGKFVNSTKWFHRSYGIKDLQRKDVVMFNFPEGDSLLKNRPTDSYYYLKRLYGEEEFRGKMENLRYYPVDQRPRFVKRVYGLPGDTVMIEGGRVFCNNIEINYPEYSIGRYLVEESIKPDLINQGIKPYNELTTEEGLVWELYEKDIEDATGIEPGCLPKNYPDRLVFPFSQHLLWNMHNMGPIFIPKKGVEIRLDMDNLKFYERIISVFEENTLELKGEKIFINGKRTDSYKFKMDYYWVIGDNRPHSFDSRFWGFVPDNHILGKVEKVLFSIDPNAKSIFKFRSDRFWKTIE
ncbi:signal peptidase I [Plebeiibacterium marinum]|uniref:Signal peptidase I n=1 Tax=Plebeiibacterium marinum TaxID=2992111 RepID=A0AAE3MA93_9BACT|nr:signal peptidase I [Plebeiobacterium marinum]MCW3804198.1 signal peptidase I [Plebeiobacterium marinum]